MILTVLESIKESMEAAIKTIKLPTSGEDGQEGGFNLVVPNVLIEWLDQVNAAERRFPETQRKHNVPCLYVCADEASDESDNEPMTINIRIVAVCWNPGTFTEELERKIDGVGYYDLINLLERAKQYIKTNRSFCDKAVLNGGVRLSVYEEQPYPYWYGWLSFQVSTFGDFYVPEIHF